MEYSQDSEIISVLENYAAALRAGSIEQLQKTFHRDAIMYGYWDQHLIEGGIANLYDSVARHGSAPHLKARVEVLHKSENIALARLEYENNAAGKDGVDYHSLIKIKGEWKVIAKLFQTLEK
ncbi:nuclear transport factor 2 family protein [Chitinophaga varians]|uniref:nuclear transport factor 2 family protein n=1 Tax=Chitinophaga varians TaxID=2202339 RepID=UPI00165FFB47|nr:nuclear transport factor 2 family protein [Chitinophaga varians]MBC9914527.1 DUF3225 domain-containing protein [Chitinophaga varians]